MNWKISTSFLVVSATSLLPYNLFMNAHEYYFYKLRNVSTVVNSSFPSVEPETTLQREFEGFLMLFGGIACIVGAAVNLIFVNKLSNAFRVLFGHFLVLIVLVPTIVLTYIDTDEDQHLFFYLSLLLASLASTGSMGFIGGGIMGLAAVFPDYCMKTVMIGQAFPGVVSAVLSIVCQAFTKDAINNGRVYFFIALVWTVLSLFFYGYLLRMEKKSTTSLPHDEFEDERLLVENEESDSPVSGMDDLQGSESLWEQYKTVYQQCRLDLFSVGLTLLVTLSGFPAVASLVKSTSRSVTWTKYFTSICFVVFNVGDVIGRFLGNSVVLPSRPLLFLCALRAVFIPLIGACNVQPRYHSVTFLPFDGVFILAMLMFAISNGFTLSISIVNVTRTASENYREVAGSMSSLICVVSALIGSIISVAIVAII